jgi:cytochrome P450 family 144
MVQTISGTHLLNPSVIAEPYGFYEELQADAPAWEVAGTEIFTVATYQLLAEAAARVEDYSSNLNCLLSKGNRLPATLRSMVTESNPVS